VCQGAKTAGRACWIVSNALVATTLCKTSSCASVEHIDHVPQIIFSLPHCVGAPRSFRGELPFPPVKAASGSTFRLAAISLKHPVQNAREVQGDAHVSFFASRRRAKPGFASQNVPSTTSEYHVWVCRESWRVWLVFGIAARAGAHLVKERPFAHDGFHSACSTQAALTAAPRATAASPLSYVKLILARNSTLNPATSALQSLHTRVAISVARVNPPNEVEEGELAQARGVG
jgi:hypothetical protein